MSVIWLMGGSLFGIRRTPLLQLLTMPLMLFFWGAVLASLVCVFSDWRQYRWRALYPLCACAGAILLTVSVVRAGRALCFAWSLPRYEAVIHRMESGDLPVSAVFDRIGGAEAGMSCVYGVFGQRSANGILLVYFEAERGFPVLHSGFLYVSAGRIEPGSRLDSHFPIREKLRDRWYSVSN